MIYRIGETFGIATAEAVAAGVPIAGFASCGVLESAGMGSAAAVQNALVGWPPSALALAEAAERLLTDRVRTQLLTVYHSCIPFDEHFPCFSVSRGIFTCTTEMLAQSTSIVRSARSGIRFSCLIPLLEDHSGNCVMLDPWLGTCESLAKHSRAGVVQRSRNCWPNLRDRFRIRRRMSLAE